MDPMFDQGSETRGSETTLDALFAEYRRAIPEPDGGANFMPKLWRKIEARRVENVSVFRRLAQVCLLATAALTLVMSLVIPKLQNEPVYTATYVDVLNAAHANDVARTQFIEVADSQ